LFCELVLHDGELLHHGGVLFLGPGTDGVFIVVAKDGVKHAEKFLLIGRRMSADVSDRIAEIFCSGNAAR
jgi:hypothetical protein